MNSYHDTIDELIEIANIYDVKPIKVISVFNEYMNKEYTNLDKFKAIELTERYIGMNYPIRTKGGYKLHIVYDIRKEGK
jgi:hypothetical protein